MAEEKSAAPKAESKRGGKGTPRPLMIVFQMLDESGNPMPFQKERLKVLAGTRDGSKALEAMEGHEHATYARVTVE